MRNAIAALVAVFMLAALAGADDAEGPAQAKEKHTYEKTYRQADREGQNAVILELSADIDYSNGFLVQGRKVTVGTGSPSAWRTSKGPVRNVYYKFARPLPKRTGWYYLSDVEADGKAEWRVEQPTKENGFTCRVWIHDFADGHHTFKGTLRECTDFRKDLPGVSAQPGDFILRAVKIKLPANVAWFPTGFEVAPDSELTIHPRGQWTIYAKSKLQKLGPEGLPATGLSPLMNHTPWASVIAKTSGDASFYVGPFARRVLKGGALYLSQNGKPSEIPRAKGALEVMLIGYLRKAETADR